MNDSTPPPAPSKIHTIFVGPQGLRSGWSLLIFLALLAALIISGTIIGQKAHLIPPTPTQAQLAAKASAPAVPITPAKLFIPESIQLLALLFVTFIMSRIERRPQATYGLGGPHKLKHFLTGLAWGVLFLSLLVILLTRLHLLVFDTRLLFGADALHHAAIWLAGFFLVGLLEEYFTRGYLQYTLARALTSLYQLAFKTPHSPALGFWTAALFISILFGLGHSGNPGESPIGLLSASLAAMVFCLSLWRTGSLWWAIGFHAAWNWCQSFLYGVADSGTLISSHLLSTHPQGPPLLSGGATGPEGSIYVVPILALTALIIILTLPANSLPDPTTAPTS